MTTRLPNKSPCPVCRKMLDAASALDGSNDGPTPGDVTVCINCGMVLKFTQTLGLAIATPQDVNELSYEQAVQIAKAQQFILRQHAISRAMNN